MDFEDFSRRAEEILGEIPATYLRGVTGVEVHAEVRSHDHLAGVYTLGTCEDDPLSRMTDPEALRSRVHLFHGSFVAIALRDRFFDWEAELRETILHEIRHHLEDRAGLPDLRDEDAMDEALHRHACGEDVPPGWYRLGEAMEPDVWRVGDDLFVELRLRPADLDRIRGTTASLTVLGEPLEAEIPEDVEPREMLSFEGAGLERAGGGFGDLHLALGPGR